MKTSYKISYGHSLHSGNNNNNSLLVITYLCVYSCCSYRLFSRMVDFHKLLTLLFPFLMFPSLVSLEF